MIGRELEQKILPHRLSVGEGGGSDISRIDVIGEARIIVGQVSEPIPRQRDHGVIAVGIADAVGIILVSVLVFTRYVEPCQRVAQIILDASIKQGGAFGQQDVYVRHATGNGVHTDRVASHITMHGQIHLLRSDFPTASRDRHVEIAIGVRETNGHQSTGGLNKHKNARQRRVGIARVRHPS